MYGRLVVATVVATVVTMAAFAAAIGFIFARSHRPDIANEVTIGPYRTLVSLEVPTLGLIAVGIAGIALIAATAIGFEMIAAQLSVSPRHRLLTAYRESASPDSPDGTIRVTVLIPAHNEDASLPGFGCATRRSPTRVARRLDLRRSSPGTR